MSPASLLALAALPLVPWALPPSELASQSLFRLRYEGPRGSGSQRVVLRLESETLFRLQGSDPLGRTRWSLETRDGEVVFVDHRAEAFCRADGSFALPEPGLEVVPVSDLPRVLAGRLPAAPAAELESRAAALSFRDARGRRWTASLDEWQPTAWTLWSGGEPAVWWSGGGSQGVLSARRGTQLRWRRTAREPLAAGALDEPLERSGLVEVGCSALYPEPAEREAAGGGAGTRSDRAGLEVHAAAATRI